MQNNLADLNNHLFEQLEMLAGDELDSQKLEKELKKAKAMCDISKQILKVADVQIKAIKTAESCGLLNKDMPELIAIKDSHAEKEERKKNRQKLLEAVK